MKQGNPPRWALTLFRWLCNDHLSDAVLGDLLELYDRRRSKQGKFKADSLFILNVIQFIQPFAIRRQSHYSINNYDMLKNYFMIAWRNMSRHKLYTGITVGGFALGLATCMMIFLFIMNEVRFDKHYKDQSRIFRLYNHYTDPDDNDKWTNMQTPLAGVLRTDLPDVELIARVMLNGMGNSGNALMRRDDVAENSFEKKIIYADPDILDIFEIPMVYGNRRALDRPYTIVLDRTKAKQFFGDIDPVGKTLIINDDAAHPYTVGGVMEDSRRDTHFQYEFILTLKDYEFWPGEQTDWCCWNYSVYLKLHENVNPADFEQKLIGIRDTYSVTYMRKTGNRNVDDFIKYQFFKLQPIADIYLHPEISSGNEVHGDITYVLMFGGIALVILILACINFINLSTAKSANRAKEVGLRKVVGSLRKSLITQFLTESVAYSLLSFVIAFAILLLALPTFNFIAGRSISVPWTEWWLFPVLISAALLIGIVAGLYPAFYLSAFRPISVLRGSLVKGAKGSGLRSTMVVFQFTASIVLIIGTFVIYRQMNYIMNHDVGFDKEQVMIIDGTRPIGGLREVLKNELMKLSDVERVSVSSYLPVEGGMSEGYAWYQAGREKLDEGILGSKYRVDPDYISTMKIKLLSGRDFNRDMRSDSMSVLINEAMARDLVLKEPLGARISDGARVYTVIGVVQDFNTRTMRAPIRPMALSIEPGGEGSMAIRLRSNDLPSAITSVENTWNKVVPNQPFRYSFMDERFALMYDDITRMGEIFAGFATLAIVVACLGLLALSAFITEQRGKEISIRRVMGASVHSIFGLLTGNFMKLVAISWIIGTPVAWYLMNKWLDGFSFREPIASDILIISGLIVGFIALTTVAWQSVRAAVANPVENLRQN